MRYVGFCFFSSGSPHTGSQAIGILDEEAEEDESFREEHDLKRPQSHEANLDLIAKHSRYLKILEQASGSDKQVRDKWDEWREIIEQLCWDEVGVPLRISLGY